MKKILCVLFLFGMAGCSSDTETGTEDDVAYDESGIEAWGQASEERETGKSDTPGCSGVIVPDSGDFGGRVALSFDDGPNPTTTNKVLDVLEQYNIKASFFINGSRVNSAAARETLARIVRDGHVLANHSENHKNLKSLDLARVESEVDDTHQIIEDAGVPPRYFRFPFGSSNCATYDLVESFGYRVSGWHVDSADWCFASGRGGVGYCDPSTFRYVPDSLRDDMPALVMEQTQRKNGGILLFHDVHKNTADSIETIIQQLIEAEFTFVNIDDVSTFPLLNSDDIDDFAFIGTTCEEKATCDFFDGDCHTYDGGGFCVKPCEGFCDDFPGRAETFCVSLDEGQTGSCVSKSERANDNCAEIPGTSPQERDRFIGSSSASESTATVCVP